MRQALAVTGFVQDSVAKRFKAGSKGAIQVRPERGVTAVLMEVDGTDVVEVRQGSTTAGETLVQLILRDKATVRTIVETRLAGKARLAPEPPLIAAPSAKRASPCRSSFGPVSCSTPGARLPAAKTRCSSPSSNSSRGCSSPSCTSSIASATWLGGR